MHHQSYALGHNHYLVDPDLPALLRRHWRGFSTHQDDLAAFGELAGGEAYRIADHVDHQARPVLVMHDLDGNRIDRVRLSPAQEELLKKLAPMNRPPYEGRSWTEHFTKGYLLADPGLYCILIITNCVAYTLHKYAPQFEGWKTQLLSGEAWGPPG